MRQAALDFARRFAVVKFECPAAKEVPLRRIFYDEVQEQLEERYDIEIEDVDLERDYDNKGKKLRFAPLSRPRIDGNKVIDIKY